MAKPTIPEQIGKDYVLKLVKENQPISIHALYKKSGYGSYSGMYDCIKRLEDKGLVIIEKKPVTKYIKMIKIKEEENE